MTETDQPWNGFLRSSKEATRSPASEAFAGKRILITGAGGYIGSAIARALSTFGPHELLLLDTSEHGLYSLDQQLRELRSSSRCEFAIGSVADAAFLEELFLNHQPQIVLHAAALKHVPLMEINPFAAVETNALGTDTLVRTAEDAGVDQLIVLSTDKAVDPLSLMGATKRIAELLALAARPPLQSKAVRLGNVLGSSGSVAPLFVQQLAQCSPLTVTHPEATRFFLSLRDAVNALLLAASPEYAGGLLIPQLDRPYLILDLARFLIAQESSTAQQCSICYTGLRPGDKLHEQMTSARESVASPAPDRSLLEVQSPALSHQQLAQSLDHLRVAIRRRDLPALLSSVAELVPEYTISEHLRARIEAVVTSSR